MWDWFVSFLTDVLAAIAGVTGDWGIAVIVLTFIIRLIITPLMTKSTVATARMQVLQPKMKEIQDRYADDPDRQMQEMRKFQAENNFNPLGGCLPMIVQMPVFFALFTVARNVPSDASFLNIMPSISMSVSQAVGTLGFAGAWVYLLFDVGFGVMTLVQMLVNIQNVPEEQRQQNLMMGVMMGVMMVWFGWSVPAAVLLYYVTSTLWQVIQQQLVTKRVIAKVKSETEAQLASQPVEINVVRREHKPRPKKKS
ncbi:MAG: YidC/Oxa1 family membrane protein insertase [Acidobacteriota bacterium]|nr:YidC/Oxa1 family membrane protein insertase [Acidobacteriota bacterium]